MRDFFAEPRYLAGFHILIFYIKVFNKPHKGFCLRRTLSTSKAETRGERRSAEKDPFLFPKKAFFFTVYASAVLLPVEPHLFGAFDAFFPAFAKVVIPKLDADGLPEGFAHRADPIMILVFAVKQSRREIIEFAAFGEQGR